MLINRTVSDRLRIVDDPYPRAIDPVLNTQWVTASTTSLSCGNTYVEVMKRKSGLKVSHGYVEVLKRKSGLEVSHNYVEVLVRRIGWQIYEA